MGAAVTKLPVEPDADLLRLGLLFDDAWRAESSRWQAFPKNKISDEHDEGLWAAADAAAGRTSAVADQIERIAATTLEGLLVKLRVLSWTHSGEPFCDSFFSGADHPCFDERMAIAIFRDLAAMSDTPIAPPDAACATQAAA